MIGLGPKKNKVLDMTLRTHLLGSLASLRTQVDVTGLIKAGNKEAMMLARYPELIIAKVQLSQLLPVTSLGMPTLASLTDEGLDEVLPAVNATDRKRCRAYVIGQRYEEAWIAVGAVVYNATSKSDARWASLISPRHINKARGQRWRCNHGNLDLTNHPRPCQIRQPSFKR